MAAANEGEGEQPAEASAKSAKSSKIFFIYAILGANGIDILPCFGVELAYRIVKVGAATLCSPDLD